MSDGPSLPFRALARAVSLAASGAEIIERIRYRRAELRRITPARISGRDGAAVDWTTARVRGVLRPVLGSEPGSQVAYDVMLPPRAMVRSWCAIEAAPDAAPVIEFEIEVAAGGSTTSARRQVSADRSGAGWSTLEVAAPCDGPGRIVLRTSRVGGADGPSPRARWGHPRVESPRPPRDVVRALRAAVSDYGVGRLWQAAAPANAERLYALRTRSDAPSRAVLRAQRAAAHDRSRRFTLITLVDDVDRWPWTTSASVLNQSYLHWEWILVVKGQASTAPSLKRLAGRDSRIRMVAVPGDTSLADAWNAALRQATGEFAGLLDEGDALSLDALHELALRLEANPDLDLIYADEDRRSANGRKRSQPRLKPEWSPELLLSSNYIGRLAMFRTGVVLSAGGFRPCQGAEEWDLLLRLSRTTDRIRRVPRCLYHRDERRASTDRTAAVAVVADHFTQLGRSADISLAGTPPHLSWPPRTRTLVSIVVPNRDAFEVLDQCARGVLEQTAYRPLELVVVDNGSTDPRVIALYGDLERSGRGRIVPFAGPFNFSAACNAGAAASSGGLLLFLNNDIEVIEPGWLDELVRWAELPEIGVVGAKLLYPDRTIQHAGVVFGIGLVGHIFARASEGVSTPFGSPESYRNYLAVTGACQMMRREVFERLGRFDERFRLSFSDVVLCMEAWKAGYRVVYTPFARLVHHESYTRKREDSAEDMLRLARYLTEEGFVEDPFFHPELDPKSATPALRPPFDASARQVVGSYIERVLATARAAG